MRDLLDTHVHVWDLDRLHLDWISSVPQMQRSFLTRDYLDSVSFVEDLRAVYLEVDVAPGDRPLELEYVAELLSDESTPFVAAVVAGDPASGSFDSWRSQAAEIDGVRGFRMVLHPPERPRGLCLEPAFIQGVRSIGAAGMHFELCMRAEELLDAVELARAAPETPLVLDHFGNPKLDGRDLSQWRESLARVAEEDNIVCKVSGLFQNTDDGSRVNEFGGILEQARSCFGAERLMFGSNWPVCTIRGSLRAWLDAVEEITLNWLEADRVALFEGNAARFYDVS